MDSVIDMQSARSLIADAALWPHLRDFLWDFAPQIHPTRLPAGISSVAGQPPRIKRYVLETLEVAPVFHDFPATDNSRLLLLDSATLEGIAKWMGALLCQAALRRIMDGAKVRALKAAMPDVYPVVFSYTAYFTNLPQIEAGNVDDVLFAGYGALFALVSALPEGLLARLKLKLPTSADAYFKVSEIPAFKDAALSKILKLKFPEAHALCCS